MPDGAFVGAGVVLGTVGKNGDAGWLTVVTDEVSCARNEPYSDGTSKPPRSAAENIPLLHTTSRALNFIFMACTSRASQPPFGADDGWQIQRSSLRNRRGVRLCFDELDRNRMHPGRDFHALDLTREGGF